MNKLNIGLFYSENGQGHKSRCEGLYNQFKEIGIKVSKIMPFCNILGDYDIIVVDAEPDKPDLDELSKHCKQLVIFSDVQKYSTGANLIVINAAAKNIQSSGGLGNEFHFYGREYTCLRNASPIFIANFCNEIKISNLGIKSKFHNIKLIDVSSDDFDLHMDQADIRITTGGQTYLEALQYDLHGKTTISIVRNKGEYNNVESKLRYLDCEPIEKLEKIIYKTIRELKYKASTFYTAKSIMDLYRKRYKL